MGEVGVPLCGRECICLHNRMTSIMIGDAPHPGDRRGTGCDGPVCQGTNENQGPPEHWPIRKMRSFEWFAPCRRAKSDFGGPDAQPKAFLSVFNELQRRCGAPPTPLPKARVWQSGTRLASPPFLPCHQPTKAAAKEAEQVKTIEGQGQLPRRLLEDPHSEVHLPIGLLRCSGRTPAGVYPSVVRAGPPGRECQCSQS